MFGERHEHRHVPAERVALGAGILFWLLVAVGVCPAAEPTLTKPKVRAVTAFVRLDRTNYPSQVEEALRMLRLARAAYEQAGFEVQTIRISTQPFPE